MCYILLVTVHFSLWKVVIQNRAVLAMKANASNLNWRRLPSRGYDTLILLLQVKFMDLTCKTKENLLCKGHRRLLLLAAMHQSKEKESHFIEDHLDIFLFEFRFLRKPLGR